MTATSVDPLGKLALIDDAKRAAALAGVRSGRVYDLGHVLDERVPVFPGRYFKQTLVTTAHHANPGGGSARTTSTGSPSWCQGRCSSGPTSTRCRTFRWEPWVRRSHGRGARGHQRRPAPRGRDRAADRHPGLAGRRLLPRGRRRDRDRAL